MRQDPVAEARGVVAARQARMVNGVLLDLFSAQAVVAVADAGESYAARLSALPVETAARVALRALYPARAAAARARAA